MKDQTKLPATISELVAAQNNYNSTAFAALFTDDAVVHDEGKQHTGIPAIRRWNEAANEKYRTKLETVHFSGDEHEGVLQVLVSGNFDGSPIRLHYNFTFEDSKIKTLKIS
ncbi:nuclear transport factor 2 family protein [Flavobacterium album]|nr:nuclear transport factor 2 family protein [Flavobacterium album]